MGTAKLVQQALFEVQKHNSLVRESVETPNEVNHNRVKKILSSQEGDFLPGSKLYCSQRLLLSFTTTKNSTARQPTAAA
jgi:hypothetical protein